MNEKCRQLGTIKAKGFNEMTARVYSTEGLSPSIRTFCGGNQEVKIAIDESET